MHGLRRASAICIGALEEHWIWWRSTYIVFVLSIRMRPNGRDCFATLGVLVLAPAAQNLPPFNRDFMHPISQNSYCT